LQGGVRFQGVWGLGVYSFWFVIVSRSERKGAAVAKENIVCELFFCALSGFTLYVWGYVFGLEKFTVFSLLLFHAASAKEQRSQRRIHYIAIRLAFGFLISEFTWFLRFGSWRFLFGFRVFSFGLYLDLVFWFLVLYPDCFTQRAQMSSGAKRIYYTYVDSPFLQVSEFIWFLRFGSWCFLFGFRASGFGFKIYLVLVFWFLVLYKAIRYKV
jgi:hypothetical protein